ncbi:MAG: ZIP family metal transporter [Candidatus Aenigmarchaeota archaeon]|nr:ZIP family metal transporter [Candidatus Aenigmarchaeota archaeon]
MATELLYTLGSVVLVSLISLIGVVTLSIRDRTLRKFLLYFVSFSAGALLGDAFIHLIPEAVEGVGFTVRVSAYILLGIVVSFAVEKVIHWKHCHHPGFHMGALKGLKARGKEQKKTVASMNLFGDGIHNFIDGLIIGGSYLVSIPLGIATTLAVIFHEIPQEIGDFGVLLHGGFTKGRAIFFNFLSALTAVAGGLIAILLGSSIEGLSIFLVTFAAGSFIYIASANLLPELHKEAHLGKSLAQLLFFIIGIGVMFALLSVG